MTRLPRHPRRLALRVLAGLVLLLLAPVPAAALSEYEIKAGFLFNFLNFIAWPEEQQGPKNQIVLLVMDTGPTGQTVAETLKGEAIHGKPLRVVRSTNPADAKQAQMVFVPAAYGGDPHQIFQAIGGAPVITVGETDSFIAAGGMINFVAQANRIRFEINPQVAQKAGLKISSQLLKLAIIKGGPQSRQPGAPPELVFRLAHDQTASQNAITQPR